MTSILVFLTAIALGLLTAGIAQWKGRPPTTWLLYGAIAWFLALPYLLMQSRRPGSHDRTALPYFVGAAIVLAFVALLAIYGMQTAALV